MKRHYPEQARRATPREIVEQNITAVLEMQRQAAAGRNWQDRLADSISDFSGSMLFVYLHVIWFGVWIVLNVGLFHHKPLTDFDPFPFGLLTLVVSLEAIFLSTFVLISQNRLAYLSEKRAELDLQVNLLAEQKTTKVLEMLDQIILQLNQMDNDFHVRRDPEVEALKKSPSPGDVLRVIDRTVSEHAAAVKEKIDKATEELADDMETTRQDVGHVKQKVRDVEEDVEELREKLD
jgi:uncharacterized membrane protein